jgi:hypothetical protein
VTASVAQVGVPLTGPLKELELVRVRVPFVVEVTGVEQPSPGESEVGLDGVETGLCRSDRA